MAIYSQKRMTARKQALFMAICPKSHIAARIMAYFLAKPISQFFYGNISSKTTMSILSILLSC